MKCSTLSVLALMTLSHVAAAYQPSSYHHGDHVARGTASITTRSSTRMSMKSTMLLAAEQQQSTPSTLVSRETFLLQPLGVAMTVGLVGFFGGLPAHAAKYGAIGAAPTAVLDPSTAEVDKEILGSRAVQSAIQKVQNYKNIVAQMKQTIASNPQANIRSTIIKDLDPAYLRSSLNEVNDAFGEDTQRGTDRLIRTILQDITELEQANQQKEGIPRSSRRLDIMNSKLDKLEQAFDDYLAFSK